MEKNFAFDESSQDDIDAAADLKIGDTENERKEETKDLSLTQKKKAHIIYNSGNNKRHNKKKGNG